MAHPHIVIVGSLNADLISYTSRLPAAGETLSANGFATGCGGKGSNQAIATARLAREHVQVSMVGCIGDDHFGEMMKNGLVNDGINVNHLRVIKNTNSGVANIIVEEATGENRILIFAGANAELKPETIPRSLFVVPIAPQLLILQLEIPLETVLHVIRSASEANPRVPVLLNPAPAVKLPEDIYPAIDILVLNETEASILSGMQLDETSPVPDPALNVARSFRKKGSRIVIITLGAKGAVYIGDDAEGYTSAVKTTVVDTTGAGDTFIGAFAAEWVEKDKFGRNLEHCVAYACQAAAWSVGRKGTAISVPRRSDLPNL
jgi:ribokinase